MTTLLIHCFFTNQNASEADLQKAYDILVKYKTVSPEIMANSFKTMNVIYGTLSDTGFISHQVVERYLKKVNEFSSQTSKSKQEAIRQEIV